MNASDHVGERRVSNGATIVKQLVQQLGLPEMSGEIGAITIQCRMIANSCPRKFQGKPLVFRLVDVAVQKHIRIEIKDLLQLIYLHEVSQNKPPLETKQIVGEVIGRKVAVEAGEALGALGVIVNQVMLCPIWGMFSIFAGSDENDT